MKKKFFLIAVTAFGFITINNVYDEKVKFHFSFYFFIHVQDASALPISINSIKLILS